jgi:hypothetical protein
MGRETAHFHELRMNQRLRSRLFPLFALVGACSAGEASVAPSSPAPSEPSTPSAGAPVDEAPLPDTGRPVLDLRIDGVFARAAHPLPGGALLVIYETPVRTTERWGRPLRMLAWIDASGRELRRRGATEGRELLDAVVHPSGEITIVEASSDGFVLVRLGASGDVHGETWLVDEAIFTDPPTMGASESRSPIEVVTHDVARIAVVGEGAFLATRTGRHSVIAYHVDFGGSAFAIRTRTLVVPAHSITPSALNGGTYDTFGQLDAHYGVSVAVDSSGIGWVGVEHARMDAGAMVKAHEKVFGEKLVTDPDWLDVFVTRVSLSGKRLGTSVVSTPDDEQLYALRAANDGVYALGRSERWNAEGTGFDALVAHIDTKGTVDLRTFDVERGDVAFDALPAKDGGVIVVGASGYRQNPSGASISEESHTFVRWLRADGTVTRLHAPDGPRHSEARFVLEGEEDFVVGGMIDGPGTHSADSDPRLLRARAFVTRTAATR